MDIVKLDQCLIYSRNDLMNSAPFKKKKKKSPKFYAIEITIKTERNRGATSSINQAYMSGVSSRGSLIYFIPEEVFLGNCAGCRG